MRELEASLQPFGDFLLRARLVKEKAAPYCVRWVRQFLARPASNEPLLDHSPASFVRSTSMGSAPRSGRASWPFADGTLELAEPAAFHRLLDDVRATDWVVYAKRPFAGPEQVLAYLGRYTHRIAIANDRLLSLEDGRVRFRWKDYADHDRPKVMSLAVEEFLRRFLLHVLPAGFWRMRHFGLLANRRKRQALARCREILAHPTPAPATEDSLAALVLRLTGLDILQCPICRRGRMLITRVLPRVPAPPPPPDTS